METYLVYFANLSIYIFIGFCWVLLLFLSDFFKQNNLNSLHKVLYISCLFPTVAESFFVGNFLQKTGFDIYSLQGFIICLIITIIPAVAYKLILKNLLLNKFHTKSKYQPN
jgi:hypothetical protein